MRKAMAMDKLVRSRLRETWVVLVYAPRCVDLDLFARSGILGGHVPTCHHSRFLSVIFDEPAHVHSFLLET